MAIAPVCACCGRELDRPGAIVFGPPADEGAAVTSVKKYHVCRECFEEIRSGHLDADWSGRGRGQGEKGAR